MNVLSAKGPQNCWKSRHMGRLIFKRNQFHDKAPKRRRRVNGSSEKICICLGCNIGDIVEFADESKQKSVLLDNQCDMITMSLIKSVVWEWL